MIKYLLLATLVGPLHSMDIFSMGCQMAESCLWQTCVVNGDSGWWIVNCDVDEDDCGETLVQHDITHVSCKPCYNMECHGCSADWEGCKPTFLSQNVGQCPCYPDVGQNCGIIHCPMHPDVPGGTWECPGVGDNPIQVEEGVTCVLWCDDGSFGGVITCVHDGNWNEDSLVGCQ